MDMGRFAPVAQLTGLRAQFDFIPIAIASTQPYAVPNFVRTTQLHIPTGLSGKTTRVARRYNPQRSPVQYLFEQAAIPIRHRLHNVNRSSLST